MKSSGYAGVRKKGIDLMDKKPENKQWRKKKKMPPQQQKQIRHGPGDPNRPPPQRGIAPLNRWLLVIVLLMLGIFLYQVFNNNNNSNTPPRDELSYSSFYNQINAGNVKSVTLIGSTDITGLFCTPVTASDGSTYNQFHVVQLPNGDPNLVPI